MKTYSNKEGFWRAPVAGWCWLTAVILALLFSCHAMGAPQTISRQLQASICRITNQHGSASDIGSGTLIDKTNDGREGLVLTCAHLFRDGVGEVLVSFADGQAHRAKLIARDEQADLAALAIAHPRAKPVEVVLEMSTQANLHACGYGPRGIYRCAIGPSVGQAVSAGQMSLLIGDPVRSGDSGGGVFDEQGRLVAVIWGEAQGVTYASFGQPLRQFLDRVLGRRTEAVFSCPNGVCPVQPNVVQRPVIPSLPRREEPLDFTSRWNDLQRQLEELRTQKQDRGDYLTLADLPNLGNYVRHEEVKRLEDEATSRHASLIERLQLLSGGKLGKAAGTSAAGLLGLSGPASWGVIAAASVGGWLIGRRMQRALRGAGGRRKRRFPQ